VEGIVSPVPTRNATVPTSGAQKSKAASATRIAPVIAMGDIGFVRKNVSAPSACIRIAKAPKAARKGSTPRAATGDAAMTPSTIESNATGTSMRTVRDGRRLKMQKRTSRRNAKKFIEKPPEWA
jgi:predicted nucleotide-binding protein